LESKIHEAYTKDDINSLRKTLHRRGEKLSDKDEKYLLSKTPEELLKERIQVENQSRYNQQK
jgi:hypothetical protein